MAQEKLRVIPLGGLGEFGMNCMAIRWQDDIIVVDAGLMFPEEELLGVDIVVPDISYLLENRSKVKAILLTHGHEDHIGGLPWILSELNVPVYGTEFTLALAEGKLDEHRLLDDADLIEMIPGRRFSIGPFTIHPIHVTHSLVDCVALAIDTPVGTLVHTGDFKVDLSPPDGKPFDLQSFAELGRSGKVLALFQDSTNCDRKGWTPSERAVRTRLEEIFSQAQRRIFFSCFSSSVTRIALAFELAQKYGRKVCVIGRSMDNSTEIAQDLGYLKVPPGLMINPGQMRDFPAEKLLIMISGTQGEPMSSLSRAALGTHKFAKIDAGDTVILSSRIIPGNEKSIYRVIDHLERRDANIVMDDGASGMIHVSGHGSQEELKLMIQLVQPRFFIPVHGDYRHLKQHIALAKSTGVPKQTMLLEDGEILELTPSTMQKNGKITIGRVCIDSGGSLDLVDDVVIKDRKHISEDGIVMAIIAIDKHTGRSEAPAEVVARGFTVDDEQLLAECRAIVGRTLDNSSAEERKDYGVIKEKIRGELKRFIQKASSRRPLIMPVILEI